MSKKIENIGYEITKTFPDYAPIQAKKFVIFLLFGTDADTIEMFRSKTRELLDDPRGCAFVNIAEGQFSSRPVDLSQPDLYVASTGNIDNVISLINESGMLCRFVNTMATVHICPIIMASSAVNEKYIEILTRVSSHYGTTIFKPFLLTDRIDINYPYLYSWLEHITEGIRKFRGCRCGILTDKNEENMKVFQETNISTILFLSLLHACDEAQNDINFSDAMLDSTEIANSEITDFLYSVQAISIANPIKYRILRRLQKLVQELIAPSTAETEGANKTVPAGKMDASFVEQVLSSALSNLPKENGKITLDPIFAVPSNPSHELLKEQLLSFANENYSFNYDSASADGIFCKLRNAFIEKFLTLGLPLSRINDLMNLGSFHFAGRSVDIASLTLFDDRQFIKQGYYRDAANKLRDNLITFREKLLQDFLKSKHFTSLPAALTNISNILNRIATDIDSECEKYKKTSVSFAFQKDNDAEWLDNNLKATIAQTRTQIIIDLLNCTHSDDKENIVSKLLDNLLQNTSPYTIGGAAERTNFMKLLADQNIKAIMPDIIVALRLPSSPILGVNPATDKYIVCMNPQNPAYTLFNDKQLFYGNDITSIFDYKSSDRIDILRISTRFTTDDILTNREIGSHAGHYSHTEKTLPINNETADYDFDLNISEKERMRSESIDINESKYWPLEGISGTFNNGTITFNWKPSPNMRSRVHFVPISDMINAQFEGGRPGINTQGKTSANINFTPSGGVRYVNFTVFTCDHVNADAILAESPETLLKKPYLVRVPTGRADVSWNAVSTPIKSDKSKNIRRYTVKLESTANIAHGILGFSFEYGGCRFKIPFPEAIVKGRNSIGPFYLFGGAVPTVCTISPERISINLAETKKGFFRRLIDMLLRRDR